MGTLNARVHASIDGSYSKSADLGTAKQPINKAESVRFTNGTGFSKGDILFEDTRTITSSGNDTLDVQGSLSDIYGATIAAASVKALEIHTPTGNTGTLIVGTASGTPFGGWMSSATYGIRLAPGDGMVLYSRAGKAAVAATSDILTLYATGGDVEYDVRFLGATAT